MENLKTSKEWYDELRNLSTIIILDPDGWDRFNYNYSFCKQLITKKEFKKRLFRSTIESTCKDLEILNNW